MKIWYGESSKWLIITSLAVALFNGCRSTGMQSLIKSTTDLTKIHQSVEAYVDKVVTIEGTISLVIDVPFTSEDFFKVHDGTGEIWVHTTIGSPPKNARVRIEGLLKRASDASTSLFTTNDVYLSPDRIEIK